MFRTVRFFVLVLVVVLQSRCTALRKRKQRNLEEPHKSSGQRHRQQGNNQHEIPAAQTDDAAKLIPSEQISKEIEAALKKNDCPATITPDEGYPLAPDTKATIVIKDGGMDCIESILAMAGMPNALPPQFRAVKFQLVTMHIGTTFTEFDVDAKGLNAPNSPLGNLLATFGVDGKVMLAADARDKSVKVSVDSDKVPWPHPPPPIKSAEMMFDLNFDSRSKSFSVSAKAIGATMDLLGSDNVKVDLRVGLKIEAGGATTQKLVHIGLTIRDFKPTKGLLQKLLSVTLLEGDADLKVDVPAQPVLMAFTGRADLVLFGGVAVKGEVAWAAQGSYGIYCPEVTFLLKDVFASLGLNAPVDLEVVGSVDTSANAPGMAPLKRKDGTSHFSEGFKIAGTTKIMDNKITAKVDIDVPADGKLTGKLLAETDPGIMIELASSVASALTSKLGVLGKVAGKLLKTASSLNPIKSEKGSGVGPTDILTMKSIGGVISTDGVVLTIVILAKIPVVCPEGKELKLIVPATKDSKVLKEAIVNQLVDQLMPGGSEEKEVVKVVSAKRKTKKEK